MLLSLLLAMVIQAPSTVRGSEARTFEVVGTVELTAADALEAARLLAEARCDDRVRRAAARVVACDAPAWLPDFVRERVIDRWATRQVRNFELEVLDRTDRTRDHGFGPSFQTTLEVVDPHPSALAVRALTSELDRAGRGFALKCLGTVSAWFLLALACWWIDRLSRGYMTARLLVLASAACVTVPAVAFLFD